MEEISWGQRIFGWSTPQALKAHNYQQEANLHNFFNPLFKIAYPLFNLLVSVGLFLLIKYKTVINKRLADKEYLRLLPVDLAPFYAVVFLLLFLQSCVYNTELTEEVVAVFGLAYAFAQKRELQQPEGNE